MADPKQLGQSLRELASRAKPPRRPKLTPIESGEDVMSNGLGDYATAKPATEEQAEEQKRAASEVAVGGGFFHKLRAGLEQQQADTGEEMSTQAAVNGKQFRIFGEPAIDAFLGQGSRIVISRIDENDGRPVHITEVPITAVEAIGTIENYLKRYIWARTRTPERPNGSRDFVVWVVNSKGECSTKRQVSIDPPADALPLPGPTPLQPPAQFAPAPQPYPGQQPYPTYDPYAPQNIERQQLGAVSRASIETMAEQLNSARGEAREANNNFMALLLEERRRERETRQDSELKDILRAMAERQAKLESELLQLRMAPPLPPAPLPPSAEEIASATARAVADALRMAQPPPPPRDPTGEIRAIVDLLERLKPEIPKQLSLSDVVDKLPGWMTMAKGLLGFDTLQQHIAHLQQKLEEATQGDDRDELIEQLQKFKLLMKVADEVSGKKKAEGGSIIGDLKDLAQTLPGVFSGAADAIRSKAELEGATAAPRQVAQAPRQAPAQKPAAGAVPPGTQPLLENLAVAGDDEARLNATLMLLRHLNSYQPYNRIIARTVDLLRAGDSQNAMRFFEALLASFVRSKLLPPEVSAATLDAVERNIDTVIRLVGGQPRPQEPEVEGETAEQILETPPPSADEEVA